MQGCMRLAAILGWLWLGAAPAPGADRTTPPTVDLPHLLQGLLEDSPTIRGARHEWEARTRQRAQVTALPDPLLEFRDWLRQMDPADDEWSTTFTQRIPWPEKRRRAGRIADAEARQAYWRYLQAVGETISEVKQSYHEMVYIDRALEVTRELEAIYTRLEALGAQAAATGRAALPETFRATTQRTQLAYDVIRLAEMRRVEEEELRFRAGLPDDVTLVTLRAVPVSGGPPPPLEQLFERMALTSQELGVARSGLERAEEEVKRARVASTPDLQVAASYSRTGGGDLPGGDPTADPVTATLGVTLPIWQEKYRAQRQEARALQQRASARADEVRLDLRFRLTRAHFEVTNAWRLVELHRRMLLPQSDQARLSAEELHRRGEASLLSVLEATSAYHSFRLAAFRAGADYHQAVARLEALLGAPAPGEEGR